MMSVCALASGVARAQQNIGSTALANNRVSRELSGAEGPLNAGDPVYRDELVRTGEDSTAKLIFLDSTNLAIGPTSRVTLDQFVDAGEVNGQKMTVNLAKGIFRFTTGALDKRAYTISTPTASIGVRGTVLDIAVARHAAGRTGSDPASPSRAARSSARARRLCGLLPSGPGQTAKVKKVGGANQASFSSTPVDFASLCAGGSLCSGSTYASASPGGGDGGGFPSGALCGH